MPDYFMTDVDPALGQQILDIPQTQRKQDVHHHNKPNNFGP